MTHSAPTNLIKTYFSEMWGCVYLLHTQQQLTSWSLPDGGKNEKVNTKYTAQQRSEQFYKPLFEKLVGYL
jgi:hypothetical protein